MIDDKVVPLRPGCGPISGQEWPAPPAGESAEYKALSEALSEMQRAMRAWCVDAKPSREDAMLEADGIGSVMRQIAQLYTRNRG